MDAKPSRNGVNAQAIAAEEKWNKIYSKPSEHLVVDVLAQNHFLLPRQGVALDLACGVGANAMFLAEQGLESHAWDVSSVALNVLQKTAQKKSLNISTKQGYIEPKNLPKNSFDVIVLAHFLDRSLCNAIMDALKSGGLLFYQTYTLDKLEAKGPKNPVFLLAKNELLQLFKPLDLLVYRENSVAGDLNVGERNEALFVGQKNEK